MIDVGTAVTTQATPAEPATPPTPTPTHYEQVAQDLSKVIDEMLALIPTFVEPHPTTKVFVNSHQSVSNEFIASTIAAVEASPELQSLNRFDVKEARDILQFISAFRPMTDKLNAAAKNLQFTMSSRRATIGIDALQVYAIIKGMARDPESTMLSAHVDYLKRDLGRAGKGGRKKDTPAPAPTTPVPSTGGPSV